MRRTVEGDCDQGSAGARRRPGCEGDLDTIDLGPPPGPSPLGKGSAPLLPGRPPARPTSTRPQRLPPPPLTDVDFHRWVFAPFDASLARLEAWTAAHSAAPSARTCVLPGSAPGRDRVRLTVLLRRGRWRRPVRMELALDRGTAPFGSQLTLRPLADIRPGRRYFREGHTVLDSLEAALESPTGDGARAGDGRSVHGARGPGT